MKVFTGNKNVDLLILQQLNDKDLGNLCQSNRKIRALCKNETFWMNRTLQRFESIIGNEILLENRKIYNSWREYYIDLVDFLEKLYENKIVVVVEKNKDKLLKRRDEIFVSPEREDLIKLNRVMVQNTDTLEDLLYDEAYEKAKEFLQKNSLVNPNRFFWFGNGIADEIDDEDYIPILQILKKDPRFRAKDLIVVALLERLRPSQIIIEELSPLWKWNDILDQLFEKINAGEYILDPVLFVEAAIQNGATKDDVKKYLSTVTLFKEYRDPDEFGHQQHALYNIRKYLRSL